MGGEWIETTVGAQATLQRGVDITRANQRAGTVPVVSSGGVSSYHDTSAVSGPGVILGRKGVVGSVYYLPSDYWPHDTTLWVKDFHGNEPRFVYYFFRWLAPRIATMDVGSANPTLNRNHVHPIEIHWPVLVDEQRAIAHILGTMDDKIELNRQMNETLEAMARTLFKSWFVDFDPVRAKAAGRDPCLPKPLADLFPASLVDSELGEIPEGWGIAALSDCVDVVRGLSYKGAGLSQDGVPMHNLNSIYEGGGYKHDGLKHYEGEYQPQHVARSGDLIVANTEQGHYRLLIGYAAIVPTRFEGESLFSHHIYRLRTKSSSELTPDYLCHLLNTRVMHDIVSGYANGTTVNMLPMDGLQTPRVVLPPARVVTAFNDIAETTRKRHEEMVEESRTLAALRDTLLPRLISGELRVKDAEKFIGRAV